MENAHKELREYQKRIVDKVTESDKNILIALPTGGGKTLIAANIAARTDKTFVFVVPMKNLVNQARKEFLEQGLETDIIQSANTSFTGKRCIIASKDSMRIRYDRIPEEVKEAIRNGIVVFDEAHVSIEQTHKLVGMYKPGRFLGLSATPERMDGEALLKGTGEKHSYGVFDELLQEETVPSLIRKQYLTKLRYYAKPIEGITKIKPDNAIAPELSGAQMTAIFNQHNIWGDLVRSYEEYGKGRPALGFTRTIAMGETVVKLFRDAGYDFRLIHGKMPDSQQKKLLDALAEKEIDGLVNAELLTYGFDCPPVSYAFNCRHIKSRPFWFQVVGRILRTAEGKEDAIFVDHADAISEFADPECALPIMDEFIKWKANGETREERHKKDEDRKRTRECMELIQKLDPLPAELIEVTPGDTVDRLIKIIKRLTSDKENLENILKEREAERKALITTVSTARTKVANLMAENERIKKTREKTINSKMTFDYVKDHYHLYMKMYRRTHIGEPYNRNEAHAWSRNMILTDEKKLDFFFDKAVLEQQMDYWYRNFQEGWGKLSS